MSCSLRSRSYYRRLLVLSLSFAVVLLAIATVPSMGFGQAVAPNADTTTAEARAVSLPHLYLNYFRVDAALEREAKGLEDQGQPQKAQRIREHLQTYLQHALHFTDGQAAVVEEARHRMLQDVQNTWTEAMPIMLKDREWLKLNGRYAGPPPGHAQVDELQKELEMRMENDVVNLKQELGPDAAARLESYIQAHLSARPITPPRAVRNPANDYKPASPYLRKAEP